jgi:2-oxoglutarate dehydrogenase E1 component
LFDEFESKLPKSQASGDVKYHQGFSSNVMTPGGEMHLALAFNPSHLEIVGPVAEGSVRARQDRRLDASGSLVVPVLIHGDAAFSGQGVVMETFQMSQTRGFKTGGTIHVIIQPDRLRRHGRTMRGHRILPKCAWSALLFSRERR